MTNTKQQNFVADRTFRPIYAGDKVAYLSGGQNWGGLHVEIIEVVDVDTEESKIVVNRDTRQTKIQSNKCIVLADRSTVL